jgi:hypothetical protein
MKVQKSTTLSAFGGINFVLEHLRGHNFDHLFNSYLPPLAAQSEYSWKDIIYSLLSVFLCGGDCIEDLQTHLKDHFQKNPFIKLPSPDTVLKRLSELSLTNQVCRTNRGAVDHAYNHNSTLGRLNTAMLKQLGVFSGDELTLDYDNTIIFNEKSDSKMTYKRDYGYQPGICTVNEEQVLFIEGRNGNSDAKSFQHQTLARVFDLLKQSSIRKADHFRADAASYQYEVIKLLDDKVNNFYIGCRNSYVEKYFAQIPTWEKFPGRGNDHTEIGELLYTPFSTQAHKDGQFPKQYRLIVKRKPKEDGQINLITQDAYEYRAILTNNTELSTIEVALFYNRRGNMERQFDVLKNDFGWNRMPFSNLQRNTVFLYLTAICRNLYAHIIAYFANRVKGLKATDRVKKFLFRFIILPAKWVERSRQKQLRVYGKLSFYT